MRATNLAALISATLLGGILAAQDAGHGTRLPLAFVENRGQVDEAARFVARSGGMTTFVTRDGFVVQAAARSLDADALRGVNLFFAIEGASGRAGVSSAAPLPGHVSWLVGDDASKWVIAAPTFSEVTVGQVVEGCDLRFHGDRGLVEYDLNLAVGRNPETIVVRCDGADAMSIDALGALVMHTPLGELRQEAPTTWRVEADGRREIVPSRFRLIDERRFGFEVDGWDPRQEIVIDPTLSFSGYLSGSGADEANAVAVDASGAMYVAGRTGSSNFPKTAGVFDVSFNGAFEGFVTKINASGTAMVYSTYIGSPGTDNIHAIVVNATGQATITGNTGTGFPVTAGAYDTTYAGWKEAFVARLNATGTGLVFATYIGGGHEDIGNGVAVDASGNVYVVGQTQSTNFPATAGSYDGTANGSWDAFVIKLNATASAAVYSTLIGGSGIDWAYDVDFAPTGEAIVCGGTSSTNFPTTAGAFDSTHNGSMDAFVVKLNATGTGVVYSTVLGSGGSDQGIDLAVDGAGCVYLTGVAIPGFPTTPGSYDTTNDNGDAFVAKLAPDAATLVYSTFIGGSGTEQGSAIAIDASGAAYIVGYSNSTNLATTTSAHQSTYGGGASTGDGLVAKLNPSGTALDYCSYFGGTGYDDVRDVALDGAGGVYVAGSGVSPNLPFSAAPFSTPLGIDEAFFAKFLLTGLACVNPLGSGCSPIAPASTITSQSPVLGTMAFVTGASAPAGAVAQIFVSAPVQSGTLPNGCPLYVDPLSAVLLGSCTTTGGGDWQIGIGLPPLGALAGITVNLQAVFWDPTGAWGYELSGGLGLTLGY